MKSRMGKRKNENAGEIQKIKKHKNTQSNWKESSGNDNVDMKRNKKARNKNKGDKAKDNSTAVKRSQNMQEILLAKLRKQMNKKAGTDISIETPNSNELNSSMNENKSMMTDSVHKDKLTDKSDKELNVEANTEKTNDELDEIDPEKAAIRLKKREKRKQKKLKKAEIKQLNIDRAGTAKASSIEYLNTWNEKREEWKFNKTRQVWLLHNMYDQEAVSDENFQILLQYLEGLKGQSRGETATEAEKIIEKAEDEETEESTTMMERAKEIIQLLSS
ncbi:hypothetical protein ACF0H5_000420 [Mactra antiquata]